MYGENNKALRIFLKQLLYDHYEYSGNHTKKSIPLFFQAAAAMMFLLRHDCSFDGSDQ